MPGGAAAAAAPALCQHLCEQEQSMVRTQIPNIWGAESFLSTLTPECYVRLLQEHLYSCLPCDKGWEWIAATMLRTEINSNLASWPLPGSYKPSTDSGVPKWLHQTTSTIFPESSLSICFLSQQWKCGILTTVLPGNPHTGFHTICILVGLVSIFSVLLITHHFLLIFFFF